MTYESEPKPAELPKLSIEVAQTVGASMQDQDPSVFIHEHLHRISRENPVLYDALMSGAVQMQGQHAQESFRDGAVLVYALLSAQIETEQMNRQF